MRKKADRQNLMCIMLDVTETLLKYLGRNAGNGPCLSLAR